MSKARIYIVDDMSSDGDDPRMVRAISQSQAVKHVTRQFKARVATAEDVARWLGAGVKVENAGASDTQS